MQDINYSIIIPHYNIPDLLGRCLRSIPEREDIQVIVVDDQSPDRETYMETIPELCRPNVEFYVVDEKKFAGHARNVGLEHAKGKWLLFADPDDFFADGFISLIDEYKGCDSDIVYFNFNRCDCDDITKTRSDNGVSRFSAFEQTRNELIFRLDYSEPWGKMVRRKLVEDNAIKFQETRAHNDLFFGVQVGVLAEKITIVDKVLYWYTFRVGSTGNGGRIEPYEKVQDRLSAWMYVQRFLENQGYSTQLYLPVKVCLRAFHRDFKTFCRLIWFLKNQKECYWTAFWQTIAWGIKITFGAEDPGFSKQVYKL